MITDSIITLNINTWNVIFSDLSITILEKSDRNICLESEYFNQTLLKFGIDILQDILNTYRYITDDEIQEIINFINFKTNNL